MTVARGEQPHTTKEGEMVAEQQAEPRWRRAGPPYEMTREEIVEFLREQGYGVTERQLQHWLTRGVLPTPDRKLPRGATDGKPRAMYPGFMASVVRDLLEDAAQGRDLAELATAAPRYIEQRRAQAGLDAGPIKRVTATRQVRWRAEATPAIHARKVTGPAQLAATSGMTATGTITPRISQSLARQVLAYAKRFAQKNGTQLERATLVIDGADGQRLTLTLDSGEALPSK